MKLVHSNFLVPIEFEENKIINLIIESPQIFNEYLGELYQQVGCVEGRWVLSEKGELVQLEKFCEVIIDPYGLDINNRKIIGKLYEEIKHATISSELLLKWHQLYPAISRLLDELIDDFNFHLEYIDEIDIKDFLKFMNVRFVADNASLIEKVIDYMCLHHNIVGTKLFVLVNIKSFFTEEQLKYLHEQALYQKFHLLLLENHDSDVKNGLEKKYLIDKDSCVIYS